jgi:predicted small secreted protein
VADPRIVRAGFQETSSMRKVLTMAALAGAVLVSACNTVHGVGRDVSSAGDAVAGAADKSK